MREFTRLVRALGLAAVVAIVAVSGYSSWSFGAEPKAAEGKQPVGTIQLKQVQAAYIGSGSTGQGTLFFKGQSYPFNVSGLGVGGIGFSTIDASGEVYDLESIEQFPGTYLQGRYGFAIGTTSAGELWLKNERGVTLHLKAKRQGFMLSLGGDAVSISMPR